MPKILFTTKEQFDTYISAETGVFPPPTGKVISIADEPDSYPCVGVMSFHHDPDGPDYIDGDYVYPNDFNI